MAQEHIGFACYRDNNFYLIHQIRYVNRFPVGPSYDPCASTTEDGEQFEIVKEMVLAPVHPWGKYYRAEGRGVPAGPRRDKFEDLLQIVR